ncbi:MAG TPA: hypothetical protein VGM57_17945 [Pseudolabrys sp.]|jgi:hypothetical protein
MEVAEELEHWREFYLLVGTGGGTLVALLFVAVSLGVGFLTQERADATRTFFSPIVVHFALVFFVSCIALIPTHSNIFFATIIGLSAAVGLCVSTFATYKILTSDWTQFWVDRLAYGVLPALGYASLLASAWMVYAGQKLALDVMAGALLFALLVNIRNAWDLMLDMVRRHKDAA